MTGVCTARRIVLLSYAGLWITLCTWYFIIEPPHFVFSSVLRVAYIALLLLPLSGLLGNHPRVYMWSSYLMLIFFSHAVIETYANADARLFAILELILSTSYFIAATLCARRVRQQAR